jgi:DeoR/GlpR family transcriptional regulator of sugar metabolism
MLKQERQAYILHQVNLHNKILSVNLCQEMNVSEDTIRRDLVELSSHGKLIKVHGGAMSNSFTRKTTQTEEIYSADNKKIIAQKAASMIKDGMFVLTSGGTTIIELARALPPQLKATFLCGSLPALFEYMLHPNIEVIVIGDKLSRNARITVGPQAIAQVKAIKADICFLGINAIDLESGITDNDWEVVMLKKAMLQTSRHVVGLTIAEKLNTVQPIHLSPVNGLHTLITELPPGHENLVPFAERGLNLL